MSSGALTAAMGRSTRDRDITNLVPSSPECSYAACFCEVNAVPNILSTCTLRSVFRNGQFKFQENVWKLAEYVRQTAPAELSKTYVVFVSNRKQVVPLWRQRAGRDEEKVSNIYVMLIFEGLAPKPLKMDCVGVNGFIIL